MRKKGFVFIETLVVIAVLTTSLIMLYSSYNSAIINEKRRLRYNDSAYLYRTYYLSKFFRNYRLDYITEFLNDNSSNGTINMITGFNCQNDSIFTNASQNIGLCENLLDFYHVRNLYLTYNDLSYLQDCTNTRGKCEVLIQVEDDMANFLKTVGGSGKTGYRMIVEFTENKDGTNCTSDECIHYYTSISLGEL